MKIIQSKNSAETKGKKRGEKTVSEKGKTVIEGCAKPKNSNLPPPPKMLVCKKSRSNGTNMQILLMEL